MNMKYDNKYSDKLNSSNYGYGQKAMNATEGRVIDEGSKKYSAFANPKERTVPMAGAHGCGYDNMKGDGKAIKSSYGPKSGYGNKRK